MANYRDQVTSTLQFRHESNVGGQVTSGWIILTLCDAEGRMEEGFKI